MGVTAPYIKLMPLYEYRCKVCSRQWTEQRSVAERDYAHCCFQQAKRLPSAPSIQFKGSGFYATDYKKTKTDE